MSTVKAALGGRIPLVNLDQGPAIPCGFVFQLADQFAPAHITDAFSEAVVLEHVLDGEALDADHLVLVNDAPREFVLIITTTISNLGVDPSDFETGLRSILRAFFLLGVASLSLCQFLLILTEELRIAYLLPRRRDHHRLQAQVKPYLLIDYWERLDVLFYQDGDKVAICSIFGNRDRGGLASLGQRATPMDVEGRIHLGQGEVGSIPFESRGSIFGRLLTTAALELGVCCTAFKEVAEGFVQVTKRLLRGHTGDLTQPGVLRLFLEIGEHGRGLMVAGAFLPFIVGIRSEPERPVVDETRTAKGPSQHLLLLGRRIDAV